MNRQSRRSFNARLLGSLTALGLEEDRHLIQSTIAPLYKSGKCSTISGRKDHV